MLTRGLIIDHKETEQKGIDPEREAQRALNRWKERPVEQQLVELRLLRDDLSAKLDLVREDIDDEIAADLQGTIDGLTAQVKRFEKICRRRHVKVAKADRKTDIARKRLVDHLRQVPEKVPTDGNAPINKWSHDIKQFLDKYDRDEDDADDFDKGWARMTDRERVETGYEWLNNLMMNDYEIADKMGVSREHVAEFYRSIHDLEKILDAEDRVKKIPNDPAPALDKDDADRLLADMDAKGHKAIYLNPNEILGKKGN